jgi:hypothetical protein
LIEAGRGLPYPVALGAVEKDDRLQAGRHQRQVRGGHRQRRPEAPQFREIGGACRQCEKFRGVRFRVFDLDPGQFYHLGGVI